MRKADPVAAAGLLERIREAVLQLETFPLSGRVVPERVAQGYRELIVEKHRIVYAVSGSEVRVLRVWHSRRGVPDV